MICIKRETGLPVITEISFIFRKFMEQRATRRTAGSIVESLGYNFFLTVIFAIKIIGEREHTHTLNTDDE